MEPLRNRYRIVGFWPDEHRVEVYFPERKENRMVILPVDAGRYPEGNDLDNYIMSFFPGVPATKQSTQQAENQEYIQALVKERYNVRANVLEKRNRLLAMRYEALSSSDWTQLPDVQATMPDEDKRLWKEFRQALRDITKQPGWPDNVEWPKRPFLFGVTIFNG